METLSRLDSISKVQRMMSKIVKQLSFKKDYAGDKVPRTPMEAVSVTMISYGTQLGEESVYGKALTKCGSIHDKLAVEQLNFVIFFWPYIYIVKKKNLYIKGTTHKTRLFKQFG